MSTLHMCVDEGAIVGDSIALPTPPYEYQWRGREPEVGCNRLVCPLCGAEVRSQLGCFLAVFLPPREGFADRVRRLYDAPDWSAFPGVVANEQSRLYACRCYYQSETGWTSAFDPSVQDASGEPLRSLPWTCGGHPPATLPMELDGVTVAAETLRTLVAMWTREAPAKVVALRQLTRLGASAGMLEETMVDLLVDQEVPTRAALVDLWWHHPYVLPLERALPALAAHRSLFRGVTAPRPLASGLSDLDDAVVAVLGKLALLPGSDQPRLIPLLREAASHTRGLRAALSALAVVDGTWLVENAERLAAACPDEAGRVVAEAAQASMATGFNEAMLRELARRVAQSHRVDRAWAAAQLRQTLGEALMRVPGGWGALLESELKGT